VGKHRISSNIDLQYSIIEQWLDKLGPFVTTLFNNGGQCCAFSSFLTKHQQGEKKKKKKKKHYLMTQLSKCEN
jgi:hypothetical protein